MAFIMQWFQKFTTMTTAQEELSLDADWRRFVSMSQDCVSVNDRMLAWYDAKPNSNELNAVLPELTVPLAPGNASESVDATVAPTPDVVVPALTAVAEAINVYATAHSIYVGTMLVSLTPARGALVATPAAQTAEEVEPREFTSQTVAMELRARLGKRPRTPANLEMGGRVAREILKEAGVSRAEQHYMSVLAVNMWFQATQLDCVLEATKTSDF
jgi:hypothetical protein